MGESVVVFLVLGVVLGVAIVAINRIRAGYLHPGDDRGDWGKTLMTCKNLRDEGVLTDEEYRKIRTLVEPRLRLDGPGERGRLRPPPGERAGPDIQGT